MQTLTLGYQKEHIEALFRSLMLVLLDNGTAEYSFITAFFSSPEPLPSSISTSSRSNQDSSFLLSPGILTTPLDSEFEELKSNGHGHGAGESVLSGGGHNERAPPTPSRRVTSFGSVLSSATTGTGESLNGRDVKEEQNSINAVWKQVMDPVLTYCEVRHWVRDSVFFGSLDCEIWMQRTS